MRPGDRVQLSKSYQLIRKLAAGGMAEVFLARTEGPRGFSKTLVLKRILPHLAGDDQFVEMFLSEARLVAQINHPNVVQIFDFGEFEGAYYIAMEYIDGPNLRTLMRRAHSVGLELEPALCARMVASACEGLAYAHELVDPQTQQPLGLVHRDVSPDNILIARNGTVKVVDFGIAKSIGQQHRTKAGTIKGKLPYMPPEQMRGRPLDRRADVFALGVVLYELLTFKRPFGFGTEVQLMEAVIQKPMTPLKDHRPDVPEAIERIIARCLAKDREGRYPSCRHLRADLERFILSAGEPVGAEELAGMVARLLPATQQSSEPVELASSRETSASKPRTVPIRFTERSAQESLLDAAWEAGLAPTARRASQSHSRGRSAVIAALLICLVAAVGGAIMLWRVPTPQPEAPVEHPPIPPGENHAFELDMEKDR
jgi:serine/threonine-protein kinase